MGLSTFGELLAERGKDWQDHFRQVGREQAFIREIAEENGVSIDSISQRFPNQTADGGAEPMSAEPLEEKAPAEEGEEEAQKKT